MQNSYIRTRKDGIWEIIWKDDRTGKERRKTTKTRDKVAAEEEHARFILASRVSGGRPTVAGVLDHYYAHIKATKGHSTWYNMQYNVRALRDRLGAMYADDVSQATVDDYKLWRGRSVEPGTVKKDLTTLRAALNHAHRHKHLAQPAGFRVEGLKYKPRTEWLSKEEVKIALDAAEQTGREHIYAFILLAFATGARREAILTLTWDMVYIEPSTVLDWENFTVTPGSYIDFGAGRGNKHRPKVALGQNFLLLNYLINGGDRTQPYVVTYRGKPVKSLKKGLAEVGRVAGLKTRLNHHVLKHSAVTNLVRSGLDLEIIEELTNTRMEILKTVYNHHRPDLERALGSAASLF